MSPYIIVIVIRELPAGNLRLELHQYLSVLATVYTEYKEGVS